MEMQMKIEDFDKYTSPTGTRCLRHTNAIRTILIMVPRGQQEAYLQLLANPLRWMDTVRFPSLALAIEQGPDPDLSAAELKVWSESRHKIISDDVGVSK